MYLVSTCHLQPQPAKRHVTRTPCCQSLITKVLAHRHLTSTVTGDCKSITSSSESKVRRLSIHNTSWPAINKSKLRSLTISSSALSSTMLPLSSCFHLLRVLDLEDCNLCNHPSIDFVGKLLHLRYLSLSNTGYVGDVPREIGKLQFLQSFLFDGTDIKEVPLSIFGLGQLMILSVGHSARLPTSGLRNLSSLELLHINVDSACIAEELGHLTQLKFLVVNLTEDKEGRWDESICRVLVGSLGKLHKLQTLVVGNSDDVEVDLEGSVDSLWNLSHLIISGTSRLPTWINPTSFLHLSSLYIGVDQIRSEDIHVLSMLQALHILNVKVAGTEQAFQRFMISQDAFPCVIRCKFSGFSTVPSMLPPGAMPMLQQFKFYIRAEDFGDSELTVNDLFLCHLPSLQYVRVRLDGEDTVSEELAMKVKEVLKKEARDHPNHPDIDIRIDGEWIQLWMYILLFLFLLLYHVEYPVK